MNLESNVEHEELRRTVRHFLEGTSPMPEVRRLMETDAGFDRGTWSRMARELELQGIALPEEVGGSGWGFTELGIVMEEMGRALFCGPFFSTVVLAANALLLSGDEDAARDLLPGIVSGTTIATLAVTSDSGRWDLTDLGVTAESRDGSWTVSGHTNFVLDGHVADLVLALADTAQGPSLFAVETGALGMTRTPLPMMDETRKQARIEFDRTPARLIGTAGGAETGVRKTLALGACALAAELAGSAAACLDMSVSYAKTRSQFGRPIGSFQAIKHMCADMFVAVETSRSAAQYAAAAAAEDSEELFAVASLAKAHSSESAVDVAGATIQIHGGIGFTTEHDAGLYFKRAHSSKLLLGTPEYHVELLAQEVGI
jgi:alkylation response protein AidB-like acyl-CoA dehydrogenase